MSFFVSRRQPETEPQPAPQKAEPPRQQPSSLPQAPVIGFDTVIGANCTIEGTLHSGANIRIDGTFTGSLEINGNVLVGETAKITADINAKNISIAGAVRGNINGKKVQLLRTSRVWGDINASALTMEEGGFIDGKITMVQPQTRAAEDAEDGDETEADAARLDSAAGDADALNDEPPFLASAALDAPPDSDDSPISPEAKA